MRKNMGKKTLIFGFVIVCVLLSLIFGMRTMKYPKNEWHSRHECKRLHLLHIASGLNVYLNKHNNKMPGDLYDLVEENILDKHHLVCPSQYSTVKKAGFFKDSCPLFISSYRFLIHGFKYVEIPDGTVVLKELIGNHPSSKVGDKLYPSGYHVLIKSGKTFQVEFVEE